MSLLSWNVRGLGQTTRCDDVLCELVAQRPSFVALQETKLSNIDARKRKTFLPTRLSDFAFKESHGAAGGIVSAWDSSFCTLRSTVIWTYSLTTSFTLKSDSSPFTATNVYAPTAHADKPAFLAELHDLAASICEPWVVIGF
ncbi:hypothetical protein HU200_065308 [Digitaria exilis]|uniref:Endonuclease/exonuclease/phosphatase domain-containing protein n=1 Tax=Digitaria exilis TaxID=1010633 RepID=A0A835A464_9POAL|nr:hypothetical protein HU200_065308 [Digitaria exilis]